MYIRICRDKFYVIDKGVFKKLNFLKLLVLWGWLLDIKYIIWRNFECIFYNFSLLLVYLFVIVIIYIIYDCF